MILETITCSGIREHNGIEDILNLGKTYPMAEFAVQAHPSKFSFGEPRHAWFYTLMEKACETDINLAMHVNSEWRTEICHGTIPGDIKYMWDMKRPNGKPIIGRIQININGGNESFIFMANKVADIIREYPYIEFIFQYTPRQRKRLERLDAKNVPFSMLFDASGGRGKLPKRWHEPIMPNHKMGYSGGLKPENVADNLDKISTVLTCDYKTWIDAEKGLTAVDTGKFDVARAEAYIKAALNWQKIHSTNILTK